MIPEEMTIHPPFPNNIGKKGRLISPDKVIYRFTIVDEICWPTAYPGKVIYLQRIEFDDGRVELRLCYYMIGKLEKMKGKWVFGQYATLLPPEDFGGIAEEARKRGWI